jgi:hypothetical protein
MPCSQEPSFAEGDMRRARIPVALAADGEKDGGIARDCGIFRAACFAGPMKVGFPARWKTILSGADHETVFPPG